MNKVFAVIVMIFAVATMSFGQAVSVNGGSIQGSITDATGAVLPNASITITGTDTGSRTTVTSDSTGFYSIGPLIPGNYTVVVTSPGFTKLSVQTVVRTGTATTGSFKLTAGAESTTIEVVSNALQVNTDQAGVSDVISKEQIDSLPVNGRNFLDLAQVEPGVILQSGESFDPTKAGYSALSTSGVSGRTTRILLDGQDITDETVGTTIFNVASGAIGDFQLNRSTQDVSGDVTSTGQILVSTGSGTNGFHGQAFYNYQDQRALFAPTKGGIATPFQRNQFGGRVGGPIIKDKLFFFGAAERIKQESPVAISLGSVFSAINTKYPTIPSPFRETYSTARLDYNGPFGGHYFARANYDANISSSNFGFSYELYNNRDNTPGLAGGADFAKGHFTHSFRGSYEKFHNLLVDGATGNNSLYPGFPGISLRYSAQKLWAGPNYEGPQGTFQSDKQVRYDGSWTKGAHLIRYGYSLNRILGGGFAKFFGIAPRVTIAKGTQLANCRGVAGAAPCLDDPLNGYTASQFAAGNGQGYFTENAGFNLPGGGTQDWREGAYVSDNWKVSPSFTLTAGVRWSVDTDRANQDLPAPLCSDITPSLKASLPSCTGSGLLLDQFLPGLGQRVHQPYGNFGPQLGFAFSPGDHKTVIRGAFGIFYESDVFNNTTNARTDMIKKGLFFNETVVGPTTPSLTLPDGTVVDNDGGVPFATLFSEPISQSGPHFINLQNRIQAATVASGPAVNASYVGNTLSVDAAYGAPYRTPYSEQWNGGIQRQIGKGMLLEVDYVHNSTLKIEQEVDVNHVGAARYLNTTAANNAITATLAACKASSFTAAVAPAGCPGLHPAVAATPTSPATPVGPATIADFAGNGLDSGNSYLSSTPASYNGLTPATGAAFPGANPALGRGLFLLPVGRSGYDALQAVFKQQISRPVPGVVSSNLQISYSFSRNTSTSNAGNAAGNSGVGDPFFSSLSYDYDHVTQSMGPNGLDHRHEVSFGGSALLKYGPQIGIIGHFFSSTPTDLTLDITGGNTAGIFQSDVTGDGTIGDLVPGTNPGAYMRQYNGRTLNKLISQYNATQAGTLTPAGTALVAAGVLTTAQLVALNAVQQPIAAVPEAVGPQNAFYRVVDLSLSYPIKLGRIREGWSLVPGIAFYNVGNFSNFTNYTDGTLLNTTNGPAGGYLNGSSTFADHDANRVQRGTGTSDIGGPRSTEFQLAFNF